VFVGGYSKPTFLRVCPWPAVAVFAALSVACRATNPPPPTGLVTPSERDRALASARVWRAPSVPTQRADLGSNPSDEPWSETTEISCRFSLQPIGGTTPKFYCTLDSGETVKVKYGSSNPELAGEVAATRLLHALGFPVDRMYVVRSVRCWGCPPFPYTALKCIDLIGTAGGCMSGANAGRAVVFPGAVVERTVAGRKIEATPDQGWSWFELDRVDATRGGSARAEVDALRLVAILLAHWDNKGANQRLICPEGQDRDDGTCAAPLLMVQDLGATFGPLKVDLHNWRRQLVWEDRHACLVSMKTLPFNGATFGSHRISEEGRQLALGLLRPLTRPQLSGLFTAAGVTRIDHLIGDAHQPDAWVTAFMAKIDQMAAGGPCPSAAALMARGE